MKTRSLSSLERGQADTRPLELLACSCWACLCTREEGGGELGSGPLPAAAAAVLFTLQTGPWTEVSSCLHAPGLPVLSCVVTARHCLTVLEVTAWASVRAGPALWEGPRGGFSLPVLASGAAGSPWCGLAGGHSLAPSAPSLHGFFPA